MCFVVELMPKIIGNSIGIYSRLSIENTLFSYFLWVTKFKIRRTFINIKAIEHLLIAYIQAV